MTRSEELREAAYQAENEGREVYVETHRDYDVIEYIEVDGVETYNFDYVDEVQDAYYAADSYREADRNWRE